MRSARQRRRDRRLSSAREFGTGAFERGAGREAAKDRDKRAGPRLRCEPFQHERRPERRVHWKSETLGHDANDHMRRPGQPNRVADQVRDPIQIDTPTADGSAPRQASRRSPCRRVATPARTTRSCRALKTCLRSSEHRGAAQARRRCQQGSLRLIQTLQCRKGRRRRPDAVVERDGVGILRAPRRDLLSATSSCASAKGKGRVAPCTMLNIVVVNPIPIARATTAMKATNGLLRQMLIHSSAGTGEYEERQGVVPGL